MATNYYIRKACPNCGRYEEIHIGKLSIGWRFLFEKSDSIRCFADAVYLTIAYDIFDEYGRKINCKDFWDMVHTNQKEKANKQGSFSGFDYCEGSFD